jgi:outer membrane protein assembly factor BamB
MRDGHAPSESKPPVQFGEDKNVKWKVKVPGRGHSSPVIVGDQVYMATADESKQTHSVMALDKATGQQKWIRQLNQGGFPANNHPNNTEATPTIACDGESLYITFFHHVSIHLISLDTKGNVRWDINAGHYDPRKYEYGYAPSPVLYKNSVIVSAEYDGNSFIASYDRANGKELWKIKRQDNLSFSSPVIAHIAGRDMLLISGAYSVSAYDPNNGQLMWQTEATTAATCGTIVWKDDMVFASGGYPDSGTYGIKVTPSSGTVVWQNKQQSYEQSMIMAGDYLYGLCDNGVMYCWRAADGAEQWKKRVPGDVSASAVLANDLIYWPNEAGELIVFKPSPKKLDIVATNQVGAEAFASPAISGNEIYLRVAQNESQGRQEYLYCFSAP